MFVLKGGSTDHNLATEFIFNNWAPEVAPRVIHPLAPAGVQAGPQPSVSPGFLKPQRATRAAGHHALSDRAGQRAGLWDRFKTAFLERLVNCFLKILPGGETTRNLNDY